MQGEISHHTAESIPKKAPLHKKRRSSYNKKILENDIWVRITSIHTRDVQRAQLRNHRRETLNRTLKLSSFSFIDPFQLQPTRIHTDLLKHCFEQSDSAIRLVIAIVFTLVLGTGCNQNAPGSPAERFQDQLRGYASGTHTHHQFMIEVRLLKRILRQLQPRIGGPVTKEYNGFRIHAVTPSRKRSTSSHSSL